MVGYSGSNLIETGQPMALTALNHSANEHVNYLDGWRGLAIALVLEGHFSGLIPLETGRLGVDVFFCLSGYLMSGILFFNHPAGKVGAVGK